MQGNLEHEIADVEPIYVTFRRCARRECNEPTRPTGHKQRLGGTLCRQHHADAMRAWRHRRRLKGAPVAGSSPNAASSSTAAVLARVQLHRRIKRGDQRPTICAACGRRQGVVAAHTDSSQPEAIVWVCRGCRSQVLNGINERRAEVERAAIERREREGFAKLQSTALLALKHLSPSVAAQMREIASRGPAGMRLNPESPLFQQRLTALMLTRESLSN